MLAKKRLIFKGIALAICMYNGLAHSDAHALSRPKLNTSSPSKARTTEPTIPTEAVPAPAKPTHPAEGLLESKAIAPTDPSSMTEDSHDSLRSLAIRAINRDHEDMQDFLVPRGKVHKGHDVGIAEAYILDVPAEYQFSAEENLISEFLYGIPNVRYGGKLTEVSTNSGRKQYRVDPIPLDLSEETQSIVKQSILPGKVESGVTRSGISYTISFLGGGRNGQVNKIALTKEVRDSAVNASITVKMPYSVSQDAFDYDRSFGFDDGLYERFQGTPGIQPIYGKFRQFLFSPVFKPVNTFQGEWNEAYTKTLLKGFFSTGLILSDVGMHNMLYRESSPNVYHFFHSDLDVINFNGITNGGRFTVAVYIKAEKKFYSYPFSCHFSGPLQSIGLALFRLKHKFTYLDDTLFEPKAKELAESIFDHPLRLQEYFSSLGWQGIEESFRFSEEDKNKVIALKKYANSEETAPYTREELRDAFVSKLELFHTRSDGPRALILKHILPADTREDQIIKSLILGDYYQQDDPEKALNEIIDWANN